jgi:hypothetical protein
MIWLRQSFETLASRKEAKAPRLIVLSRFRGFALSREQKPLSDPSLSQ